MNVIWSVEAISDVLQIREYIGHNNLTAAKLVAVTIMHTTEKQLEAFPLSGRNGRLLGTHELVIPKLPYVVVYKVSPDSFDVLRVYHTSRMWPEKF